MPIAMRTWTVRLLLAVGVVVAAGCTDNTNPTVLSANRIGSTSPDDSTPDDSTPANSTPNSTPDMAPISWGVCDDESAVDPVLECGTLTVPLDYAHPDGGTIDLALVRVPATEERTGAVLFNPGGPGGSGFDYIAQGGTAVVTALGLQHFDLIGFDPRGVDRSNGLRCQTDAEIDRYQYLDDTPDTPGEQQLLDEADVAFENACIAKYGDTLRDYSTDNTAQDMDAIRVAIGDDTISFLGISYGTYLGATYATMFPDRVRAMVLDSAYEPTGDSVTEQYTTQLIGFEHAFDDWATWCQGHDECEFRSDDVPSAWDALKQQLDDHPLTNADGRQGNQAVMELATIAALYSDTEWPVLGAALADAQAGDPSAIFSLADSYNQRHPDGTYSTIGQSNPIISCASGLQAAVPDDPDALVTQLRQLSPHFASTVKPSDFTDRCATMMPTVTPRPLAYAGGAPILVVGGQNDPATPYRWAEEMTAAMGPSATLVTFTGEGHGQLMAATCVTDLEAGALAELQMPADGTVCDPDPDVERPAWWDDLPVPDGIGDVFNDPALPARLGLSPTVAYSEIRTTTLGADDALAAYDEALAAAGFVASGTQEPFAGAKQGIYIHPPADAFSVVILGPEAMAAPEMEGIGDTVPAGTTLVVLLYLPT